MKLSEQGQDRQGVSNMSGMRLEITTQKPQLEIRTQAARLDIQRINRPQFRVRHQRPQMKIHHRMPQMRIDRTAVNQALNRYSPIALMNKSAADSRQAALDAVARIAQDGDRMAKIYQRHNNISQIIADRNHKSVSINGGSLPKASIDWDPGQMEIEWSPNEFSLEWMMEKSLDIAFQPHRVDIQLVRHAEIKIEFKQTRQRAPQIANSAHRRQKIDQTM